MVSWVGFNQRAVEFERKQRAGGETKYRFRQMMRLASNGIFAFSKKPLSLAGRIGVLVLLGSIVALIVYAVRGILGYAVAGTALAFVGVYLLIGGVVSLPGACGQLFGQNL